jgi:uncharacterized OB-fold protein
MPQTGDGPRPESPSSRPFWDGCRRHELLFQRCRDCGAPTHTPSAVCQACLSPALTWERSQGTGEIYSWTLVWRPPTPTFHVPYAPAIIEMAEGWHILSNIVGCEPDVIRVGLPVGVVFHPFTDDVVLPYFEPLESIP